MTRSGHRLQRLTRAALDLLEGQGGDRREGEQRLPRGDEAPVEPLKGVVFLLPGYELRRGVSVLGDQLLGDRLLCDRAPYRRRLQTDH